MKRVALSLASLVVVLAVLEGGVRALALFSPRTAYLAHGFLRLADDRAFETLDEFLGARGSTSSRRVQWGGYWTNALGFYDTEFSAKTPGTLRIAAVGDSFCYGMVPYPYNVMTLAEIELARACPDRPLELFNFGIVSTEVPQYRQLHELISPEIEPDMVVVHFYMGNDGPDLVNVQWRSAGPVGPRRERPALSWSYLASYGRNAWKLARATERGRSSEAAAEPGPAADRAGAVGGTSIAPSPVPWTPDMPNVAIWNEGAGNGILMHESGRLFVPAEPETVEEHWTHVLDHLEQIVLTARRYGQDVAMVFFPSRVQVDPASLDRARELLADSPWAARAATGAFDPDRPQQVLRNFCDAHGIPCFDTTPALRLALSQGDLYIPRDSHWNVRGNRVAGLAEARFLAGELCSAE